MVEMTQRTIENKTYYTTSSNMTTYNNDGKVKSKQEHHVNDNGIKDMYLKESEYVDGKEQILLERGNKDLIQCQTDLFLGEQNKFYPAMPFLTMGCLVGYGIVYFI